MPAWAKPAAWVAGVSAILLLVFPLGFPNYDTIYALLWGREIAGLESPDQSAPLAPTPHPLLELFGAIVSPLGDGAIGATVVIAYVSLGLIGYLVYRLGMLWFDRPIGAVAAAIVLTRAPYLSNGLRAYVDLPFIAFCLAALVIETRRPRAGWPVLALLAAAGLLRPEAWLFSFAYLAYLALTPSEASTRRKGGRLGWPTAAKLRTIAPLMALAAAAPLGWALFDLITAGSPTYSFTGTRETVEELERQTGPVDLVLYGPRRLGEVLQWPGMVGAAGGLALGLAFLRRRSLVGAAGAALALAAFAVLASAGLAIIPRYTMLAAAVLAVFAAVALLGWRLLEDGHRWRRAWQVIAAVVAVMFIAWTPNQVDLLSQVDTDLGNQKQIEDDLEELVDADAFQPRCGPIAVPNHRAVPRLAFWLDLEASDIVSYSEEGRPEGGYFLEPASEFVVDNFVLDPNDPTDLDTEPPEGFELTAENESWLVYRTC